MKIILLQDVKSLGRKGDIKQVSDGYARNFLLSRKLAQIATDQAVAELEMQRKQREESESEELKIKRQLADAWKGKQIVVKSKEKNGKLFGSVAANDIAKILKQKGLEISDNNIILENPIKKTGQYEIKIKLAPEVSTKIKLEVQGQ